MKGVKVLMGADLDAYTANLSKIEKMQGMETQLTQAAQTITDLTTATQELAEANTALETQVEELTSQVTALTAGSGKKPLKARVKAEGGSGDEMHAAMSRAKSVLKSLEGI